MTDCIRSAMLPRDHSRFPAPISVPTFACLSCDGTRVAPRATLQLEQRYRMQSYWPERRAYWEKTVDLALSISLKPKNGASGDPEILAELDGDEVRDAVVGALRLLGSVRIWDTAALTPAEIAVQEKPDLIFNMSEGLRGAAREAQAPALFEWLGWRYTGSDPVTLAITLDKWYTKAVLRDAGILTPRARLACQPWEEIPQDLPFPAILKPVAEGSAIGVRDSSIVETKEKLLSGVETQLKRYKQPVLVEEFLPGREFTAALMGNVGRS